MFYDNVNVNWVKDWGTQRELQDLNTYGCLLLTVELGDLVPPESNMTSRDEFFAARDVMPKWQDMGLLAADHRRFGELWRALGVRVCTRCTRRLSFTSELMIRARLCSLSLCNLSHAHAQALRRYLEHIPDQDGDSLRIIQSLLCQEKSFQVKPMTNEEVMKHYPLPLRRDHSAHKVSVISMPVEHAQEVGSSAGTAVALQTFVFGVVLVSALLASSPCE